MEQREQILRMIALALVGAFGLLLLRLWSLQVIHGDQYRDLAENNRVRSAPIGAPRGLLFDRHGTPLVRNVPVYHVALNSALFDGSEHRLDKLAALMGLPREELVVTEDQGRPGNSPQVVADGISFEDVARIETRRFEFPELEVGVELGRIYPYGESAAHLLGHLGRLHPHQVSDAFYAGVPLDTQVGQGGVEKLFDRVLRGRPGKRVFEVNATGRRTRVLSVEPPVRGADLTLSIDMRTQHAAEEALGDRGGAVVALDPRTGEVLALVSSPGFNPNLFARGISRSSWQQLLTDRGHPLFNRAIQSRYPPGSTFKVIVAVAALETGTIRPEDKVHCKGSIEVGGREFKCWEERGHGLTDLSRAIAESCDVYFYEIGLRTGIEAIARYAALLGLTGTAGLGMPQETAGLIPDPEWKRRTLGEPWYPGDTVNTSIGQGYVGVSPFHMALAYAALASGGPVPRPLLTVNVLPAPLSEPEIAPKTSAVIREGLLRAVSSPRGTGRQAASPWFSIAGKTGTAQVVGRRDADVPEKFRERDHAWFVGYAPADAPRIVVSTLIEHGGHGGTAAAPLARDIMEAYLAPEGPPKPEALP